MKKIYTIFLSFLFMNAIISERPQFHDINQEKKRKEREKKRKKKDIAGIIRLHERYIDPYVIG